MKEEAAARARSREEDERRAADSGLQEQIRALSDVVSAAGRSAKADAEAVRSELAKHAASCETAAAATKEALQGLDGGLRTWAAEAIAHASAEEDRRVALSLEGVHAELAGAIEELRAQVAESVVPLGEPGALTTLREALWRVDALGKVVARLCDHVAKYASAAEAQEFFRDGYRPFPSLWPGMFVAAQPRSPGRAMSPSRAAERRVAWASGTPW